MTASVSAAQEKQVTWASLSLFLSIIGGTGVSVVVTSATGGFHLLALIGALTAIAPILCLCGMANCTLRKALPYIKVGLVMTVLSWLITTPPPSGEYGFLNGKIVGWGFAVPFVGNQQVLSPYISVNQAIEIPVTDGTVRANVTSSLAVDTSISRLEQLLHENRGSAKQLHQKLEAAAATVVKQSVGKILADWPVSNFGHELDVSLHDTAASVEDMRWNGWIHLDHFQPIK